MSITARSAEWNLSGTELVNITTTFPLENLRQLAASKLICESPSNALMKMKPYSLVSAIIKVKESKVGKEFSSVRRWGFKLWCNTA